MANGLVQVADYSGHACKSPEQLFSSFKFQVLFVTYTTIQRLYNQQWNVSWVRSTDSANIEKYNTREVYIK